MTDMIKCIFHINFNNFSFALKLEWIASWTNTILSVICLSCMKPPLLGEINLGRRVLSPVVMILVKIL
jgi:hypothetical protein